jgi:hypothetical protein
MLDSSGRAPYQIDKHYRSFGGSSIFLQFSGYSDVFKWPQNYRRFGGNFYTFSESFRHRMMSRLSTFLRKLYLHAESFSYIKCQIDKNYRRFKAICCLNLQKLSIIDSYETDENYQNNYCSRNSSLLPLFSNRFFFLPPAFGSFLSTYLISQHCFFSIYIIIIITVMILNHTPISGSLKRRYAVWETFFLKNFILERSVQTQINTFSQKSIICIAINLEAIISISLQLVIYKIASKYIKSNSGSTTNIQMDWFSAANETGSGASNLFSSTICFEYIVCVVSAIFSEFQGF